MPKFRKKPVVIEAVKFTGNIPRIEVFMGTAVKCLRALTNGHSVVNGLIIATLEGDMRADIEDWIIKGVNGEFYPCKPDIFAKTYEPVD